MSWDLQFISEDDFTNHVRLTIQKYGLRQESYDIERFNSNIVDPIKLVFDKTVYGSTWDETIKNEIIRQRDKSNNNEIGYFHQNFFKYINGCQVPDFGWDVIYKNPNGINLPNGETVHTIYIEMKNKHNTMNSSSSAKTYMRMQGKLLEERDCACFLVEAIAKHSQNEEWIVSIDGHRQTHPLIRRVSMDRFYEIVTGIPDAFYQICIALPKVIQKVVESSPDVIAPNDTVIDELRS
ncbi:MAG: Eco47II family restriction endonuclease, partial [Nitrosarchaeum sp.]